MDFLTSIDLWVQIRGIPLPYVSEASVLFIAKTLGEVVHVDFNEETSTQIDFIIVKIGIGLTDHLRFFRNVRFESGKGAMIGFEYEKLMKICTNCSLINHDSVHCPYPVPPVYHDDVLDVPVAQVFEEGEGSNIYSFLNEKPSSQSSELSSFSSISQPPRPANHVPNLKEFLAAHPLKTRLSSSSDFLGASSKAKDDNIRKEIVNYEDGECSKRRKGQQVQLETKRNTRPQRHDLGVRFYPTEHTSP
ncbi:PREDICTED: uncharacterized protein At4g02000-like [Camelina sativa]|uniref:Uncharacterized protein At4g02000-like n=1 Tax=Camelina sativa TaxID=90675 RepID=A0ABM1R957_CAMSA|nr:PREDICTED: uncharacterized protein At4g02000-like [Camelina sativa]